MRIHTIDQEFLGTPQVIASFLIEAPLANILIETGPASTQVVLEKKIQDLGVELESIKHVLVSHIHLDHSGGAGHWARRGAQVYVHEKGARHLIEPERLLASAKRIYQDKMDLLWGSTLACPADNVHVLKEGTHSIAGLDLEVLDTPGHAAHHLAFQMEDSIFTGDVAAVRLPQSSYVSVPAPPPEFQLETWLKSLEKLQSRGASRLFLTHFGQVDDPVSHFHQLEKRLHVCVDFVCQHLEQEPTQVEKLYQEWDRSQALASGLDEESYLAYERANPSFMSAQGILRYLHKKQESQGAL